MKRLIILIGLFLSAKEAIVQDSLLPPRYKKIKEVFGDLDKDGKEEKVVVYNIPAEDEEINGVDREVVIFKKHSQNWYIWQRSTSAVGNSKDGGMMGDPFEDIEITNGILIISHSGGSSWKWRNSDKYRFQNKSLELIGYSSYHGKLCEYWVDVDFNLSTGKIHYKKEYENCDNEESQFIYKTETENFSFRRLKKITFHERKKSEVKIITPKYKDSIYL